MASSAGLFACGQSFWPILHRVTRTAKSRFSLESGARDEHLFDETIRILVPLDPLGFGLLNKCLLRVVSLELHNNFYNL